jgi:hypothetical protein
MVSKQQKRSSCSFKLTMKIEDGLDYQDLLFVRTRKTDTPACPAFAEAASRRQAKRLSERSVTIRTGTQTCRHGHDQMKREAKER